MPILKLMEGMFLERQIIVTVSYTHLGETNREIAISLNLTRKQVQQLITREDRRERLLAQGCVLRPKGRPRKLPENEEAQRNHELAKLRMQVELLRNSLLEVGRR